MESGIEMIPIRITHFINPNRFYACDLSQTGSFKDIEQMENKLQNCCAHKASEYKPKAGDLVCYYSEFSNKWLRCRVEQIKVLRGEKIVIVMWAEDYGLPLSTVMPEKLIPISSLPADIERIKSPIISCGLQVVPAAKHINPDSRRASIKTTDQWSAEGNLLFFRTLNNSSSAFFLRNKEIHDKDHQFGELILTGYTGVKIKVSRKLVELKVALNVDIKEFVVNFNQTMSPFMDRWEDVNPDNDLLEQTDTIMVERIDSHVHFLSPNGRRIQAVKAREHAMKTAEILGEKAFRQSIALVEAWLKTTEGLAYENVSYKLQAEKPTFEHDGVSNLSMFASSEPGTVKERAGKFNTSPIHNELVIKHRDIQVTELVEPQIVATTESNLDQSSKETTATLKEVGEHSSTSPKLKKLDCPIEEVSSSANNDHEKKTNDTDEQKESYKPSQQQKTLDILVDKTEIQPSRHDFRARFRKILDKMPKRVEGSCQTAETNNVPTSIIVKPEMTSIAENVLIASNEDSSNQLKTAHKLLTTRKVTKTLNQLEKKDFDQTTTSSVNEEWAQLEVGKEYKIEISKFESCRYFFVQSIDEKKWQVLMEMLEKVNTQPLKEIAVGKLCLVYYDNYLNRAKILRYSDSTVICFGVDWGDVYYVRNKSEKLYEMPRDIIDFLPFQAVHCRLHGIKAPSLYTWTSIIYERYIKIISKLKIRVMRKAQNNPDLTAVSVNNVSTYDVILYEENSDGDININDLLVKDKLAETKEKQ